MTIFEMIAYTPSIFVVAPTSGDFFSTIYRGDKDVSSFSGGRIQQLF